MVNNKLLALIYEAFKRPRTYGVYQGVRKFKHGQLCNNVWFTHSIKNNANIACESDLEKKLCLYMEFENEVEKYRPQPFKLSLDDFTYTPDFVVQLDSGLFEIREVKRRLEAESKHYKDRFFVIRKYCEQLGVSFRVFTEEELLTESLKSKSLIYHLLRGTSANDSQIETCYEALVDSQIQTTTLAHIQTLVVNLGFPPTHALHMVAKGYLECTITPALGINSKVVLGGGEV